MQGLQRQGDLEDGSGAFLLGMRNAIATLPCRDDAQLPGVDLLRHAEEITGFDFKVEIRSREADEERLQQLTPDDFLGQLFTQFRLAFGRDAQD